MGFYKNVNTTIKLFDSAGLYRQRDQIRQDFIAVDELRRFNFPDGHEVILRCYRTDRDSCKGCWLSDRRKMICPECTAGYRKDHTNVIFVRNEY